jgi:hypothetical protein
VLCTFFFCFAVSTPTIQGQNVSSMSARPVVRDEAAIALIKASMVAMGGVTINAVSSLVVNGNETVLDESSSFVWKEAGDSFRHTHVAATSGVTDEEVMTSGHFYRIHTGTTKPTAPLLVRGHFSFAMPSLKLQQLLNDSSATLTYEGNKQVGTQTLIAIKSVEGSKSIDKLLTTKTWYFDPNTKILSALDYYVPENRALSGGLVLRAMFSDYRPVSETLMPLRIDIDTQDKQLPMTYIINSATINANLAPSVFQVQ